MTRYVTIARCSQITGYTEDAIRTKIRDGVWTEGEVWRRAPDGRVLVDIQGYERWVEGGSDGGVSPPASANMRSARTRSARGPAPLP